MGLFDFLTGKTKKTNLTPERDYPAQSELYFTNPQASQGGYSLKDFAAKRLRGEELGFGDSFTDRMSSPGIAQIDKNFQNRTMPELSSQASKRGLARSSIVQDQIGQADQSRNRDIASMVANFQFLNEQQKKTDTTQAVNLASGLQDQERSMLSDRAGASERQVGRNIAGDQYQDQNKAAAGGRIVQSLGALVGGPVGATVGTALGGAKQPMPTQNPANFAGSSGVKTQLLGSSDDELEQLYQMLLKGQR